jgi:hypothetical protein
MSRLLLSSRGALPPVWLAAVAGALVVAFAGCAAGPVAAPGSSEEEAHELPAHHPRSFRRAIDAIEERAPAVASGDAVAARRELADILRWLPMLAADTELGRGEWDRVRSIAIGLSAQLDAPGGPPGFATSAREAVADLRAIADTLPAEPPAPEDAR